MTAVDPDHDGEIVWQKRVGEGGTLGGVQWGVAADESNLYVAVSDPKFSPRGAGDSWRASSYFQSKRHVAHR